MDTSCDPAVNVLKARVHVSASPCSPIIQGSLGTPRGGMGFLLKTLAGIKDNSGDRSVTMGGVRLVVCHLWFFPEAPWDARGSYRAMSPIEMD